MNKLFSILVGLFLVSATTLTADEIAVTVYNSNLGVVSEIRNLKFEKGINDISFRDVPSKIDPNSVRFELINSKNKVDILEQNYAYDLVSPSKMYQKYIDKEIVMYDEDGKEFKGKLLAYNKGEVTIMGADGSVKNVMLSRISEVSFPTLPNGLITKPTLIWKYQSPKNGSYDCNVSYQTGGMNWSAEYVAVLNEDESMLDLSGWAAINNKSGKTYNNATLKLMAGDINRPAAKDGFTRGARAGEISYMTSAPSFQEKTFFEYHMYTLPRKTTLADNEIKQISLFDPAQTSIEKKYKFIPKHNPTQVEVSIEFVNSKKNGMGMPMPAGRVRLFKADSDKSLVLLGEDFMKHTPKDEKISLRVGYAFDIVAEAKLLDQKRISSKIEDRYFEVELRNRKDEDISVEVERQLYGYWEVVDSDMKYRKKDSDTIIFDVLVKAGETKKINYTVRFTNR